MISVIVPVYKVEQYLHRCIDSILAQTYRDLEIILVDDGSPDNCGLICDEYASKDSRIKVIHKTNGGVSSARNAGLDVASGDYIAFVDSDDYVLPQYLEYLLEAILINESDISYCSYEKVDDSNEFTPHIDRFETYEAITATGWDCLCYFFKWWCLPNVVTKLFKYEIAKKLAFPNATRAEDLWYAYHAIATASRVTGIRHCKLYCYYSRTGSAIGTVTPRQITDELSIRLEIYNDVLRLASPANKSFSEQTMRTLLDFCLTALRDKKLMKCIKMFTPQLVDDIFLEYAYKKVDIIQLHILKSSPLIWIFIQLLKHKFFGMPLYIE